MFTTIRDNLIEHLRKDLGLKPKDFVFLHSGMIGLGLVEGGIATITEAFNEVLSEGTLVIPTFSYSWCQKESYDRLTTKCPDMGGYAKDAWKDERFIRNENPNFSVSALRNEHNENFIQKLFDNEMTCFGAKSVFGKMYELAKENDGHVILLGGAHNDVVFRSTFVHFVEEKKNAPYRYVKRFSNPEDSNQEVEQLVRFLSEEEYAKVRGTDNGKYKFPIDAIYKTLGEELQSNNLITIKPFGYSQSRMVHIRKFCDFLTEKMEKDPDYLLH